MDFQQAIDLFLAYLKHEKGYSEHTLSNYRRDLSQFMEWVHVDSTDQLNLKSLNEYLLNLKKRAYQKSSINRKLAAFTAFLKYLRREKIMNTNLNLHIEFPRYKKRLPKTVSSGDVQRLFTGQNPPAYKSEGLYIRDLTILAVLYHTGIRVSELISIKIADVNLSENYIRVTGKGNKERLVPIRDALHPVLLNYLNQWKTFQREVLFSKKNGAALTRQQIWNILKRWTRHYGVKANISPHKLRHTFATRLLEHEVDLRFIQELLGHSNISTTEIYTSISTKHLHNAFKRAHPRA